MTVNDNGSRRKILTAAVYALAFAVPLAVTLAATGECAANSSAAVSPGVPAHRIAIQINSDDPTTMKHAITNSLNAIKAYRDLNETFAIEIVAYGAGVHMFRADTSPVKDLLQLLRTTSPDIAFSMCGNTRMIMERNEGHPLELVAGTQVVPFGVVRLVALQEAGWSYLRP